MFIHVFTYQHERMTSTLELKPRRDLFSVKKKLILNLIFAVSVT